MKKSNLVIAGIIIAGLLTQSCTKDRIVGLGGVDTQILQVEPFTGIVAEGISDVYITYGETQEVKVSGHPNIISRVQTDVINGVWFIGLENGNYGSFELTFHLTMPTINKASSEGSGDIRITQFIDQPELEIDLMGSGSFKGYPINVKECRINIEGSGDCEVNVNEELDVRIKGSGNVYYKGHPSINTNINGSGTLISSN